MNILKKLSLLFVFIFSLNFVFGMDNLEDRFKRLNIDQVESGSDSDSEDMDGYRWEGLKSLQINPDLYGKDCIVLFRGIHYLEKNFSKKARSKFRRLDESENYMYSSAVDELSSYKVNRKLTKEQIAIAIRKHIKSLSEKERNSFQQKYSNSYDGFHKSLKDPDQYKGNKAIFSKFKKYKMTMNPIVSLSESPRHALKYAFGKKNLGKNIKALSPDYNSVGGPKHCYLGKLYIIIIPIDELELLDPYFVVYHHCRGDIKIKTHFSNNILEEREVSFAGGIPGKYVVSCENIRVPSFAWESYQKYYKFKFGLNTRSFKTRQTRLKNKTGKVETFIEKTLIDHLSDSLMKHITNECAQYDINLKYKQLDGSFGELLPDL